MSYVDASGPGLKAENGDYGYTGWEGQATYTCALGRFIGVTARLNMTYLPSSSNSHVPRLKVVWLHELWRLPLCSVDSLASCRELRLEVEHLVEKLPCLIGSPFASE